MKHIALRLKITQRIVTMLLLTFGSEMYAMTSVADRRQATSAPLLYKQMDYADKALSIEIEPWVSGMFDPKHTMGNLGIDGKSTITLNQMAFVAGQGDFNPELMFLSSNNPQRNYFSSVTLTPEMLTYGALFHCYKQFKNIFFDVKTALLKCKTIVNVDEHGGDNGGMQDETGTIIYNAYDAFTQKDWKYGKIGNSNEVIGFDNIQVTAGTSTQMHSFSSDGCQTYIAGFALLEIPTGAGTKSEWLFEPQVGTNHWAFGFGADYLVTAENGFSLVLGGNFRHMIGNWEKRSFDLTENGQWSRYLDTELIANIADQREIPGLPGINFFTRDALIQGRNEITLYGRLQKRFNECLFELSYNYFYAQKETINLIDDIVPGYGIYSINTSGGVATSSTAQVWQADPVCDNIDVEITTADFNLASGAAGAWNSSMIAARLQRVQDMYTYGIGSSVEVAHSAQALSSWSIWFNFEILLP